MRLVSTKSVNSGEKLSRPIYNDNGQTLLHEGVLLTDRLIERLIKKGIFFIYVEDERTDGVEFVQVVTEETKRKALKTIKSEFSSMANEMKLKKAIDGDRLSVDFTDVVHSVLTDIKGNTEALSLLSDVYVFDNYIFVHSLNVTIYTLGLAVELGYTEKQLLEIGLGALLHDIGKIVIPSEILNKPGRLTDEEFDIIKTHPRAGFDLLRQAPNISLLTAHCAFQHHERINGSGYPQGLKEDQIHEYAKIIGIADVFDAVTSQRVYRKPMLPHEALEMLYSGVGTLYDLTFIQAFIKTIAVYPIGLTVTLSDGRKAIVIKQNKNLSTHPVVRVISENDLDLEETYDLDLEQNYSVTIVETETTLASKTG